MEYTRRQYRTTHTVSNKYQMTRNISGWNLLFHFISFLVRRAPHSTQFARFSPTHRIKAKTDEYIRNHAEFNGLSTDTTINLHTIFVRIENQIILLLNKKVFGLYPSTAMPHQNYSPFLSNSV